MGTQLHVFISSSVGRDCQSVLQLTRRKIQESNTFLRRGDGFRCRSGLQSGQVKAFLSLLSYQVRPIFDHYRQYNAGGPPDAGDRREHSFGAVAESFADGDSHMGANLWMVEQTGWLYSMVLGCALGERYLSLALQTYPVPSHAIRYEHHRPR